MYLQIFLKSASDIELAIEKLKTIIQTVVSDATHETNGVEYEVQISLNNKEIIANRRQLMEKLRTT